MLAPAPAAEFGGNVWRLLTATLDGAAKKETDEQSAEAQSAVELVRLAKEQCLSLTRPDGPLKQLTKRCSRRGTVGPCRQSGVPK